jgi:hypothetical protein
MEKLQQLVRASIRRRQEKTLSGAWNKLTSDNKDRILIALGLVVFAVISRMLPHPPNFAPIAAIALFSGAILPRRLALTLPLFAMVISDIFIGMHDLVFVTWGSFVLMALIASYGLKKVTVFKVFAYSFLGSVLFFVVTNFAVWAQSGMYAKTIAGLIDCYVLAIPFFRNTLLGDFVYSGIIFGAYYLALSVSVQARRYLTNSHRA